MIPYGRQEISKQDIRYVRKSLRNNFLTTGPLVQIFEKDLENYIGAPTTVVSSGTAALHCAYKAINLGPGDEIITPPITFVATQATAIHLGASVVFSDIELETGNLDSKKVERLISKKTKAIVTVDFAGHPGELDDLREIAKKHGIYLIEDAAHSLGSVYKGKRVGNIADITTFSFFPTKNITTGEGGAITSINSDLLVKAREFSRQGLIRDRGKFKIEETGPWHQEVHDFGLNYRLPDVLCALGVSQLSRIEQFKTKRSIIWDKYSEAFQSIKEIKIPTKKPNVDPMWHLYPIRVSARTRENIFVNLRNMGIGVQVNYLPAYKHPAFSSILKKSPECPNAEEFYSTEISLPMYTSLSNRQISKVIKAVQTCVKNS